MRRLDLSEADALRLADVIAGKWAHRTTRLVGADCAVDNPVRTMGGESRRRAYEIEVAAWARILRQLGADPLPEVYTAGMIGEYVRPGERKGRSWFLRGPAEAEGSRLKKAVLDMIKAPQS
jgi:hypothetical protein